MTKAVLIMAAACILGTVHNPAIAQSNIAANISAIPMSEICSKDGALGQKFGVTTLPRSTALSRGTANKLLDARFAPFTLYGFSTAQYSNTMFEAVFEGSFGNEANAAAAIQDIAAHYTKLGWTSVIGRERTDAEINQGSEAIALIPSAGSIDMYQNAANAKTGAGVRISLQPMGKTDSSVTVSCQDAAMFDVHIAEVTGGYPVDMPRPTLILSPPVIRAVETFNCNDVQSAKLSIDAFRNGDFMSSQPPSAEEEYQERLAAWKSTRLVESGKIDRGTLTERQLDQIVNSGAVDALNKNVDAFSKLMPEIEKLEKLDKAGDTIGLCRGIETFKSQLSGFEKNASTTNKDPWAASHKFLDAEAKRLGVTFPQ